MVTRVEGPSAPPDSEISTDQAVIDADARAAQLAYAQAATETFAARANRSAGRAAGALELLGALDREQRRLLDGESLVRLPLVGWEFYFMRDDGLAQAMVRDARVAVSAQRTAVSMREALVQEIATVREELRSGKRTSLSEGRVQAWYRALDDIDLQLESFEPAFKTVLSTTKDFARNRKKDFNDRLQAQSDVFFLPQPPPQRVELAAVPPAPGTAVSAPPPEGPATGPRAAGDKGADGQNAKAQSARDGAESVTGDAKADRGKGPKGKQAKDKDLPPGSDAKTKAKPTDALGKKTVDDAPPEGVKGEGKPSETSKRKGEPGVPTSPTEAKGKAEAEAKAKTDLLNALIASGETKKLEQVLDARVKPRAEAKPDATRPGKRKEADPAAVLWSIVSKKNPRKVDITTKVPEKVDPSDVHLLPPPELKAPDAKPEDAKPADAKPADAKPADAKPADAKPADAKPADAKPADAKPADAKPADAKPADAKPGDAKPGDAKPGDAKPAAAKPADAKPGDAKPGDAKPGDAKPGDAKPGDAKPGDAKPGDAKPGDAKPGDAKPGDAKPGDVKPGDAKPGDAKPGDAKPDAPPSAFKNDPQPPPPGGAKKASQPPARGPDAAVVRSDAELHADALTFLRDRKYGRPTTFSRRDFFLELDAKNDLHTITQAQLNRAKARFDELNAAVDKIWVGVTRENIEAKLDEVRAVVNKQDLLGRYELHQASSVRVLLGEGGNCQARAKVLTGLLAGRDLPVGMDWGEQGFAPKTPGGDGHVEFVLLDGPANVVKDVRVKNDVQGRLASVMRPEEFEHAWVESHGGGSPWTVETLTLAKKDTEEIAPPQSEEQRAEPKSAPDPEAPPDDVNGWQLDLLADGKIDSRRRSSSAPTLSMPPMAPSDLDSDKKRGLFTDPRGISQHVKFGTRTSTAFSDYTEPLHMAARLASVDSYTPAIQFDDEATMKFYFSFDASQRPAVLARLLVTPSPEQRAREATLMKTLTHPEDALNIKPWPRVLDVYDPSRVRAFARHGLLDQATYVKTLYEQRPDVIQALAALKKVDAQMGDSPKKLVDLFGHMSVDQGAKLNQLLANIVYGSVVQNRLDAVKAGRDYDPMAENGGTCAWAAALLDHLVAEPPPLHAVPNEESELGGQEGKEQRSEELAGGGFVEPPKTEDAVINPSLPTPRDQAEGPAPKKRMRAQGALAEERQQEALGIVGLLGVILNTEFGARQIKGAAEKLRQVVRKLWTPEVAALVRDAALGDDLSDADVQPLVYHLSNTWDHFASIAYMEATAAGKPAPYTQAEWGGNADTLVPARPELFRPLLATRIAVNQRLARNADTKPEKAAQLLAEAARWQAILDR